MKTGFKGQVAVGVSVDGRDMHLVRLGLRNKQYYVLDARTFTLNHDFNTSDALTNRTAAAEAHALEVEEVGDPGLDLSGLEEGDGDVFAGETDLPIDEEQAQSDAGAFMEVARLARNSRFVLTLPEPQLFYTVIEAGAREKGKKREKAVMAELAVNRGDPRPPRRDAAALLPMTEERTLVVTREQPPRVLDELAAVKPYLGRAVPPLHSLEAFEISLVNMLMLQSAPMGDQVTVLLHIGHDTTRFLFMKGGEIHHISQTIAEGSSSQNIAGIAASRLTFELDHLNLDQVDRILLSGDACKVGMADALHSVLPEPVEVACLPSVAGDLRLPEGRAPHDLAPHAAALGAAMHALAVKPENTHEVDLLPKRLRDAQNKLLISTPGWVMLLLLPLVLVGGSLKAIEQQRAITELRAEVYPMRIQIEEVKQVEDSLARAEKALADFERSFSVIDSLAVDNHVWSGFLERLHELRLQNRYFWLNEVSTIESENAVKLTGNSLYRETITEFVDDLGAELSRVEVQEIRGKSVYRFEIKARLTATGGRP